MYGIFSRSTENEIPNKVKHFVRHSNLEVVIILSQECFFFLPIQTTLVFVVFIFNPENVPKIAIVLKAASQDSFEPFNKRVISTAN